jgi:hypothetical protein
MSTTVFGRYLESIGNLARALGLVLLFATDASAAELVYPRTEKGEVRDNYHGTDVADPFRWLEDDNSGRNQAVGDCAKCADFRLSRKDRASTGDP